MRHIKTLNEIQSFTTETYINDRQMVQLYKNWKGEALSVSIANCFVKHWSKGMFKKISHIDFKDFDFHSKVTFDDLKIELGVKNFVNWVLDKSAVTMPERKNRFKSYMKRWNDIINKRVVYVRNDLKERHGFGIYQLNQIKIIRKFESEEPHMTVPFLLIPTNVKCLPNIKKYCGKSILPELKERNSLYLKDWKGRENVAIKERESQEEIQLALEKWEKEE